MTTPLSTRVSWLAVLAFASVLIASPVFAGHHEAGDHQAGHAAPASESPGDHPGGHHPDGHHPDGHGSHHAAQCGQPASPEARAELAAAHERMAVCLRSTRPIDECRAEMGKGCCAGGSGHCAMGHGKHDGKHDSKSDGKHGECSHHGCCDACSGCGAGGDGHAGGCCHGCNGCGGDGVCESKPPDAKPATPTSPAR